MTALSFEQHFSNLTTGMLSQTASMDQVIHDQANSNYRLADIYPGIVS